MGKNYVYNEEFEIVEIYDNVFEALGFSPDEAKHLMDESDKKMFKRNGYVAKSGKAQPS